MLEDHNVRLVSILDNDFYKFTMQCAVVKLFPSEVVKYDFINRGKHEYPEGFADELKKAVNAMSQLKLTKEEKQFLKTCPYLDLPYIDFLEGYRYDPLRCTSNRKEVIWKYRFQDYGTVLSYGKFLYCV